MNRNDLFGAMEFIDEKIIENSEVEREMKNRRKITKGTIMLVAVLCLLTVFATAAVAGNLFGLRDTLIGSNDPEIKSMMSLSGFIDSNEHTAAAEWNAFVERYDTDGAIRDAIGNGQVDVDEKHEKYGAYTQEMADKIDEIAAKYGLSLHGDFKEVTFEEWNTVVGEIIVNDYEEYSDKAYNTIIGGYMYDDGTFRYDGIFTASYGRMNIDYQFSRVTKGVFDTVFLNIGDIEDYEEQVITTDSGVELVAALSEYKSMLITEFDSCFASINVMGGTAEGITFDDLKDLANTFDFSVIESGKGKPSQDSEGNADAESEWEKSYIEVSREGVVEKIPVETVRVINFDTTIAMDGEYFTHIVYEGVDTFSYETWTGEADVYFTIYADETHTAEELGSLFKQYYTDSYKTVWVEKTRIGDYDAVAVYCDGSNIIPDYNKHYFMVPTDNGCIVIEAQFNIEMYEGLYQIMLALFDTLKIG